MLRNRVKLQYKNTVFKTLPKCCRESKCNGLIITEKRKNELTHESTDSGDIILSSVFLFILISIS